MQGFSKYFTFEELTDSASHPELVAENRADAMHYLIAGKRNSKLMESIKMEVLGGEVVHVSNGHRCTVLNIAVGGVDKIVNGVKKLSKHRIFEAVDAIPDKTSVEVAFQKIMDAYKAGLLPDLRKCIIETVWVNGKLKKWLHIEAMQKQGEFLGFWSTKDGKNYIRVA